MTKTPHASSYAAFAQAEANEPRGRFGTIGKPKVTGASPTPPYPDLPSASPWHDDPVPPEPSISFLEISTPQPTGTFAEIEESLGDARDGAGPPPDPLEQLSPGDEQHLGAGAPSPADGAPSPSLHKRKRRS